MIQNNQATVNLTETATDNHPCNEQLKLFGYAEGESVFVRAIKSGAKKLGFTYPLQPENLTYLHELNDNGNGIYFVVNGFGDKDVDVKSCRAVFYEHDDRDIDSQRESYKEHDLPQTTYLYTGDKSIHHYWILKDSISPEEWKGIQSDLIALMASDKTIKNPSRVMRLAGFKHQKTGRVCELLQQAPKVEFEELRRLIPVQTKETPPKQNKKSEPTQESADTSTDKTFEEIVLEEVAGEEYDYPPLSLKQLIPHSQRSFIYGVIAGGRNSSGCSLAKNLIGAKTWCETNSVNFIDDAWELYLQFCDNCSPPLDAAEALDIWRKQEKSNPQPGLTEDFLQNIIENWRLRHKQERIYRGNHPKEEELCTQLVNAEDEKEIRELIKEMISGFNKVSIERTLTNVLLESSKNHSEIILGNYLCTLGTSTPGDKKDIESNNKTFAYKLLRRFVRFCINNELYRFYGSCDSVWLKESLIACGNQNQHNDFWQILKVTNGGLRFNSLKSKIEFDGEEIKLEDNLQHRMLFGDLTCDVKGTKESLEELFVSIAKLQEYNPAIDYFKKCYETHGYTGVHKNFVKLSLGSLEESHQKYFDVFGLSVISRTFKPGCFLKMLLILTGKQNAGKSSFFRRLLPNESWFCDDFSEFGNKDHLSKLNRFVILEIAEIDKVFKSRDRSALKSCVSTCSDDYRKPYTKYSEEHPRCSVIVGTTNECQFLNDPTGSVRFPIIEIPNDFKIDLSYVAENRDKLWADFYHLVMIDGCVPQLSNEDILSMQEENEEYQQVDPWKSKISEHISGVVPLMGTKSTISIEGIFDNVLNIPVADRNQKLQNRVADILKELKWTKRKSKRKVKDPSKKTGYRNINVWEPE